MERSRGRVGRKRRAEAMERAGMPVWKIARKLGVSVKTVEESYLGIEHRKGTPEEVAKGIEKDALDLMEMGHAPEHVANMLSISEDEARAYMGKSAKKSKSKKKKDKNEQPRGFLDFSIPDNRSHSRDLKRTENWKHMMEKIDKF